MPEGHGGSLGADDDGAPAHVPTPAGYRICTLDRSNRPAKARRQRRSSSKRDGIGCSKGWRGGSDPGAACGQNGVRIFQAHFAKTSVQGRTFDKRDRAGSKLVAIVNQSAARKYWPNEEPIGKEIRLGVGWEDDEYGEIVGVVGDVKYDKVEEAFTPQVYLPYTQPTEPASFVMVRTANDASQMCNEEIAGPVRAVH